MSYHFASPSAAMGEGTPWWIDGPKIIFQTIRLVRKTRKSHKCRDCREEIAVGSQAQTEALMDTENGFCFGYYHYPRCPREQKAIDEGAF